MFSSWDLVRPRFWYPMSSLEQSMMELEQMKDRMMRPHSLFDMHRNMFTAPKHAIGEKEPVDDDFFVDLPVVSHMHKPTPFSKAFDQDEMMIKKNKESINSVSSSPVTNVDMENDNTNNDKVHQEVCPAATTEVSTSKKAECDGDKIDNDSKNNDLPRESSKSSASTERNVPATKTDDECRNFSSYSFSSSSVLDDMGRRVTTTRRRYEDSTGQLKAVHEREIGGKKLCTTWRRQSKKDEGQHESICSSGSPEEFEALWQQTPFGEAQKETVKSQLQSESDLAKQAASTSLM